MNIPHIQPKIKYGKLPGGTGGMRMGKCGDGVAGQGWGEEGANQTQTNKLCTRG